MENHIYTHLKNLSKEIEAALRREEAERAESAKEFFNQERWYKNFNWSARCSHPNGALSFNLVPKDNLTCAVWLKGLKEYHGDNYCKPFFEDALHALGLRWKRNSVSGGSINATWVYTQNKPEINKKFVSLIEEREIYIKNFVEVERVIYERIQNTQNTLTALNHMRRAAEALAPF